MPQLKSNVEWRQWGKDDPLWAVATEPGRRRGEASAWTIDEFLSAGESDWQDFFPHWRQYGVRTASCVEIGCGAGRFTGQLAHAFEHVCAIDVSEDMIACARDAIDAVNVEYFVTDGLGLPQPDNSVDAIFSTHVLQHLDDAATVLAYFHEFHRVLASGGTIMIHVPLYDWPGTGRIATLLGIIHTAMRKISDGIAWVKRRSRKGLMRGTALHARSLHAWLAALGFKDIEFRTFATSSNGVLHSFVMARK